MPTEGPRDSPFALNSTNAAWTSWSIVRPIIGKDECSRRPDLTREHAVAKVAARREFVCSRMWLLTGWCGSTAVRVHRRRERDGEAGSNDCLTRRSTISEKTGSV